MGLKWRVLLGKNSFVVNQTSSGRKIVSNRTSTSENKDKASILKTF